MLFLTSLSWIYIERQAIGALQHMASSLSATDLPCEFHYSASNHKQLRCISGVKLVGPCGRWLPKNSLWPGVTFTQLWFQAVFRCQHVAALFDKRWVSCQCHSVYLGTELNSGNNVTVFVHFEPFECSFQWCVWRTGQTDQKIIPL